MFADWHQAVEHSLWFAFIEATAHRAKSKWIEGDQHGRRVQVGCQLPRLHARYRLLRHALDR